MKRMNFAQTGAFGNGRKQHAPPTIRPMEPAQMYCRNLLRLYVCLSASMMEPISGSLIASQTCTITSSREYHRSMPMN